MSLGLDSTALYDEGCRKGPCCIQAWPLSVACGRESESEIEEFRGVARVKVSGTFFPVPFS